MKHDVLKQPITAAAARKTIKLPHSCKSKTRDTQQHNINNGQKETEH